MTKINCEMCGKQFTHSSPHTLTCSEACRKDRYRKITGRFAWQIDLAGGTVGAISEMGAALDLMKKGYAVFRSLSPACFCDLIAVKDDKMLRIEVRTGYGTTVAGKFSFPKKTHGAVDYYGPDFEAVNL